MLCQQLGMHSRAVLLPLLPMSSDVTGPPCGSSASGWLSADWILLTCCNHNGLQLTGAGVIA